MIDDSRIFTLGSFLCLPITDGSTIRVMRSLDNGMYETLWAGSLSTFRNDIHKLERISVYTEIKFITIGNGNLNAIIVVK